MGTNFYIRRVEAHQVRERMHICKRSGGWKIHFQDSTCGYDSYDCVCPEPPSFHSVRDIRGLLESGEWQLEDEYGQTWKPGKESLDEFDELLRWNGGPRFTKPAVIKQPNTAYDLPPDTPYDHGGYLGEYRDADGYAFTSVDFS